MAEKCVAIVSGGLDSVTMLRWALDKGYEPYVINFNYGQRHVKENEYAKEICEDMKVSFKSVDVSAIKDLMYTGALMDDSVDVPKEHYDHASQKNTVVPNRNAIFINLAVAYAVTVGANKVFYAAHFNDRAIYPDCFAAGSNILMSNFSYKPIEQIEKGESVIGFTEHPENGRYRFREAKVEKAWSSGYFNTIKIKRDGFKTYVTPNHRFLTKSHANEWKPISKLNGSKLNILPLSIKNMHHYIRGYIRGLVDSDGCIGTYYKPTNLKQVTIYQKSREIIDEVCDLAKQINLDFKQTNQNTNGIYYTNLCRKKDVNGLLKSEPTNDFKRGYIAGFWIGDGTVSAENVATTFRISFIQKNKDGIKKLMNYLDDFKIKYSIKKYKTGKGAFKDTTYIKLHVASNFMTKIPVLFGGEKKERYKIAFERVPLNKDTISSKNVKLTEGNVKKVYDIQTSTGSFVCDGYLVHNCRWEFVESQNITAKLANDKPELEVIAPFVHNTKADIVAIGTKLGIDYSKTWSCYKGEDKACGKCGTCRERIEAFELNGLVDPAKYD